MGGIRENQHCAITITERSYVLKRSKSKLEKKLFDGGTVQACEFHAYLTASTRVPNVLAMARERRSFVTPIQDNVGHVLDSGDDSNEDSRCNNWNIDHPLPPLDLFTYHELHLDVKGN